MKRCYLAVLSSLSFASIATSAHAARCEPAKAAVKYPRYADKVIKIAASPFQPPFAFSNPKDLERMDGLEVEMIEKVMACAGLRYEYVKGAWSALLPTLFFGSTDVMIGAVNYRPDRAARVDFVLYMRAAQSIVVRRGNPARIADGDGLCGRIGSSTVGGSPAQTIARQSGTCVQRGRPAIDFRPASESNASYRQVVNGRVDFVVDDAAAAADRTRKQPELTVAYTMTTNILSGIVVGKGNREMLRIVADGLTVQQNDGTLQRLAGKYGIPPEAIVPVTTRQDDMK